MEFQHLVEIRPQIATIGAAAIDAIFVVKSWPLVGESVQADRTTYAPGGKGLNQAIAAMRLGAKSLLISAVCEDANGSRLTLILQREGVQAHLQVVPEREDLCTDMTAVIVLDKTPGYVGGRGATNFLTGEFVTAQGAALNHSDAVLVTFDVSEIAVRTAIDMARIGGKRLIVNASPPPNFPLSVADDVDFLVLNKWEATTWLVANGVSLPSQVAREECATKLLELSKARAVIVTEGKDGCIVASGTEVVEYPAYKVKSRDETGAGDAFCAGLAVAACEGKSLEDCISFAQAAGALATTRLGVYKSLPYRVEVDNFIGNTTKSPILPRSPKS